MKDESIYLLLLDLSTNKQFRKLFGTEFERNKFRNRLRYSRKLKVLGVEGVVDW